MGIARGTISGVLSGPYGICREYMGIGMIKRGLGHFFLQGLRE